MRQLPTVLMVVLIGFSTLQASPIIEETFTGYPDDSLISASPAGPATGLAGDWTLDQDSDFYVNRTEADLSAGTDKAVYDRPADFNGTRTATRATSAAHVLYSTDGDVFYASFVIDTPRTDGRATFELHLDLLSGGGTPDLAFGLVDGSYIVGKGGINVEASGGTVTPGEQRIVVRIEYGDASSGGANDAEVITLWVNPINESSLPVIDGAATNFLNRGGGRLTAVSMRGEQMAGQPAFFDDLRVGLSFVDVIPEPASLALLATGILALWRPAKR